MRRRSRIAVVAVLLAGVFAGGVTMAIGMLVHEVSVLVVIANAMRLLRARRRPTTVRRSEPARTAPRERQRVIH